MPVLKYMLGFSLTLSLMWLINALRYGSLSQDRAMGRLAHEAILRETFVEAAGLFLLFVIAFKTIIFFARR